MSVSRAVQADRPAAGAREDSDALVNIATQLTQRAHENPDKLAVAVATGRDAIGKHTYDEITFRELDHLSDAYARGFRRIGIQRGTRTILMVRPGVDFFAVTFALFKLGAIPVLIDPGIGRAGIVRCLAEVEAEAFIGIPLAHVLRVLYRRAFASVRSPVTVGRRWLWGGLRLCDLRDESAKPFEPAETRSADTAAILFTSGSTGPSKGVVYTHGIFDAQVCYLRTQYGYGPDEVDLATFPLFALFDAALGMTAVIPQMDASRPGSVDPRNIIDAIRDHGCTHMFGSPALLDRVSRFGEADGTRLESLKRVITAGAPVAGQILSRFAAMLRESAEINTPYGATESLPVTSIDHRTILNETFAKTATGAGVCVGRPLDGLTVRVIRITDEPIATWADAEELPAGEVGEITVKGPIVTREYFRKPEHTRLAKIDDDGAVVHRMGDVGYFDADGRLWFAGRKSHRVRTRDGELYTELCEQIFNQHPAVWRTALVGVGPAGSQTPVLCVQLEPEEPSNASWEQVRSDLVKIAARRPLTQSIATFLVHPDFPVDVRHNAKIFREKLAVWASERV